MSIRSFTELQDSLDEETKWRKREFSFLRNSVKTTRGLEHNTAIRSGVVLLYAHWEGFVKCASEAYVDFVANQRLRHEDLADNWLASSLKGKLQEFYESKKPTHHLGFIEFLRKRMSEIATLNGIRSIDTQSNLSYRLFTEIMCLLGIDYARWDLKKNVIDYKLVRNRNSIAHGEELLVDSSDFDTLHRELSQIIDEIKVEILNSAALVRYKKA
jgi:hypothetical protein